MQFLHVILGLYDPEALGHGTVACREGRVNGACGIVVCGIASQPLSEPQCLRVLQLPWESGVPRSRPQPGLRMHQVCVGTRG